MSFGRAILGDNQFLGVNHANQAKAAELFQRFSKPDAILEIIGVAYEAGLRDFMFTTHDRYDPVFDEIRRSNLFPGMHYTPCIPYAHKYWSRLSTQSLPAMAASVAMQANPFRTLMGGVGLLAGSPAGMIRVFVDLEVQMCKGLPIRGVFLQNAAFDLLMAVEAHREIEAFFSAVERRLNATPGFITMNHPKAVNVLCGTIGLRQPWVCTNYNLAGFRTHPSLEAVEASFAANQTRNIAMSVFASGSAGADSSLKHVLSRLRPHGGVDAILFGSSNAANIRTNTLAILEAAA